MQRPHPHQPENPRPPAQEQPQPLPPCFSAIQLRQREFAPIRWAVPGILPEGAALICGKPKKGKSWLVLNLAIAVASGNPALGTLPTTPGDVLYLALEDGERRLRRRLDCLLGPGATPANLYFATSWRRISDGACEHIEAWLKHHPRARLVIIDTLARVRDRRFSNSGVYDTDYAAIEHFQKLATAHGITILIVHHTRKAEAEDVFDTINASFGLSGAADGMLVLIRPNNSNNATLHVTGRDLEEEKRFHLLWDPHYCLWQLQDGELAAEASLGNDRKAVRDAIRQAGKPLGVPELMTALRKSPGEYDALAKLLSRMAQKEGLLAKERRGLYTLPGDESTRSTRQQGDNA